MEAQVINNFVDPKDCKEMIDRLEYLISTGDVIKRDDGRIGVVNKEDPVFAKFIDKYMNKTIETFNDGFNKFNGYIATKYVAGIGMNDHIDSEPGEEIGALMYLNEDYDGGELTYTTDDGEKHSVKAKAGDMVYCPSWYLHGVNKVTAGTRYFFTVSLCK
jgi:hypothetical protein